MHASSMENMERCFSQYVVGSELEKKTTLRVLDVGGGDIKGSYKEIFSGENVEYILVGQEPMESVDIVLEDPYKLPFDESSFDLVVSGQMLEHCEFFWVAFKEMLRVVNVSGFIFIIAPSAGSIHRYPVDCYRFNPDSFSAIASYSGCFLVDHWHDKRGPWYDLVGVFSKNGLVNKKTKRDHVYSSSTESINSFRYALEGIKEIQQGTMPYLEVLSKIHKVLEPRFYLELGVRNGMSLSLAKCDSVGVDPMPELKVTLSASATVLQKTSDDFFLVDADSLKERKPDLVFIDGMHLFEYSLRDFMNVELHSKGSTIVVVDDVLPNEPIQASRERKSRIWTGDVWKLYYCLKKYRKDLFIIAIDSSPTGMIMISGLDNKNRQLWENYNSIVSEYMNKVKDCPSEIFTRDQTINPKDKEFNVFLNGVKCAAGRKQTLSMVYKAAKNCYVSEQVFGDVIPKLSVIVISYNMARELPRTLKTLSPEMQKGLENDDYEIIVVDNGSSLPADEKAISSISPNIRYLNFKADSPSPVGAINFGIEHAKADLIGVMIDGARMASPGLLSTALQASEFDGGAVIGTLAFHLGDKVQMESVKNGYNQDFEDDLLDTVPWEDDAYKLFEISVLAGSSSGGWFDLPAETNALFMRKHLWLSLGRYDERFKQPGGGLANLDMWYRACNFPGAKVYMLIGEGTFHQFHGGVATNAKESKWKQFHEEYIEISGSEYKRPDVDFSIYGNCSSSLKKLVMAERDIV